MSVGRAPICRRVWTEQPGILPHGLYVELCFVLFSRVLFCFTEFCSVFFFFLFFLSFFFPRIFAVTRCSVYLSICRMWKWREERRRGGREGAGRRVSDRTGWPGVGISRAGKSTFHLQLLSWCGSKYTCLSNLSLWNTLYESGTIKQQTIITAQYLIWTSPHLSVGMDGTTRNFTTWFIRRAVFCFVFQSLVLFHRVFFCFFFFLFFFPRIFAVTRCSVHLSICRMWKWREEKRRGGREGVGRRVSDRTGWPGVGISRVGKSTFHLQLLSWCGSKYTCLSKPVGVEHVVWSWGRQATDDNHSPVSQLDGPPSVGRYGRNIQEVDHVFYT